MTASRAERSTSGTLKWTDRMCREVLESKSRAVELTNTENPHFTPSFHQCSVLRVFKAT